MADGFLGRWSRRKLDAKDGRPVEPEPPRPVLPAEPVAAPRAAPAEPAELKADAAPAAPAPEPPPTLEDAQALTIDSDFTRFVRADVPADVKNAAVKKLFSDPHFNVMDGLDTYIDDYGKPDPIPESMLRQLAASRFLGLFREEEREEEEKAAKARDDAEGQGADSVAQSQAPVADPDPAPPPAVPPEAHAHPDLRLQQDDAARPGEAGSGTG
ncbi:DUF3306 domain-containing protein [Ramlibacter sp. Leaf400]|uniref:DUF3306 domain-containing protein n=1 Tax=Ramlibacter sp. Leaf400 TaxID=1736365 RepID=UPI0006F9CA18|nr:DUF3306 domain-containing protein [Ramlibacter sp. Leaf400]KQT09780.1 hypothetical protein ASG30_14150 [Ramlibacter sp. Leaf400]